MAMGKKERKKSKEAESVLMFLFPCCIIHHYVKALKVQSRRIAYFQREGIPAVSSLKVSAVF